MRVALTGTPGTGKTTVATQLDTDLDIIHLNDVIRDHDLTTTTDDERDALVADFDAIIDWLADRDDVLIESHLAHHFAVDAVIVLRCAPAELETRLEHEGATPGSVEENVDSERLDVILVEAIDRHGEDTIYEIDTTDRDPATVATDVHAVLAGDREPQVGIVDFLE